MANRIVWLLCAVLQLTVLLKPVICGTYAQNLHSKKTLEANTLAKKAEENDAIMCELLATCDSTLAACSREVCKATLEEVVGKEIAPAFSYVFVSNNTDCPGEDSSDGTCRYMMFNFNRSYVSHSPLTDTDNIATAAHMCAQRKLDPVFKTISTPEGFTRAYFGSSTGTFRVYPGVDEDNCRGYETRGRSWYIAATTVPKAVMVLIDIGKSMMDKDRFGGEAFLETAKRAAREFLHSLAPGDFVNIIAFNAVTAVQFVTAPVTVQDHHNNDQSFPEYRELKVKLGELKADEVNFEVSNLTSAIDIALQNFDRINRPDILKVIVVLTDGAFAEAGVTLPTPAMAAAKAKLFVYTLAPSVRKLTAAFTSQLRAIGGSFINIYRDVKNPLYAMESFYSFTGVLHQRSMGAAAQFSWKLEEFSRFNRTILVASKAAFRADGSLIGVAGISIYLQMVENSIEEIKAIVREQEVGRQFDARTMVTLGPANCTIQVEPKSVYVCGRNTTLPPNRGFCEPRNFGTSIQNRSCLHPTCAVKPPPSPSPPPPIALIVGVPFAVVIVLAAAAIGILTFIHNRRDKREQEAIMDNVPPDFPLGEGEELQSPRGGRGE